VKVYQTKFTTIVTPFSASGEKSLSREALAEREGWGDEYIESQRFR
jgi:hypothetical protein